MIIPCGLLTPVAVVLAPMRPMAMAFCCGCRLRGGKCMGGRVATRVTVTTSVHHAASALPHVGHLAAP